MRTVSLSLVSGNIFYSVLVFIYLFTGGDSGNYEDKVLVFDTMTKTWRQLGEMKVARAYHAVSLVDDNGECQ